MVVSIFGTVFILEGSQTTATSPVYCKDTSVLQLNTSTSFNLTFQELGTKNN